MPLESVKVTPVSRECLWKFLWSNLGLDDVIKPVSLSFSEHQLMNKTIVNVAIGAANMEDHEFL